MILASTLGQSFRVWSKSVLVLAIALFVLGATSNADCDGLLAYDGTEWKLFCTNACPVGGCFIEHHELAGGVGYDNCICDGGTEPDCCHAVLVTIGGGAIDGKRGYCGITGCDSGTCNLVTIWSDPPSVHKVAKCQ